MTILISINFIKNILHYQDIAHEIFDMSLSRFEDNCFVIIQKTQERCVGFDALFLRAIIRKNRSIWIKFDKGNVNNLTAI